MQNLWRDQSAFAKGDVPSRRDRIAKVFVLRSGEDNLFRCRGSLVFTDTKPFGVSFDDVAYGHPLVWGVAW